MELELEQEKINLIKKIITSDKKYLGNEDLFDDFLNETYKRSFLIVKTIKNENSLEAYLRKVVTTSVIEVLKNSGRLMRSKEGFVPIKEEPLETVIASALPATSSIAPVAPVTIPDNKYSNVQVNYDIVDVSDTPEEIVIKKEVLQSVYDAILVANNLNPAKQYMELYNLRYVKGLTQKQIADTMGLSQGEVSKRLLGLMSEVKVAFDKE